MNAGRAAWVLRATCLVMAHPLEAVDRLRGRLERHRAKRESPPVFGVAEGVMVAIHRLLGASYPCWCEPGFLGEWSEASGGVPPAGHDADPALAAAVWAGATHVRAVRAVETGVARGLTSRIFLCATRRWGGELWSIDLPPMYRGWESRWGELVPGQDLARWHLQRGSSRRWLPRVLRGGPAWDMAILDSSHTTPTVRFECQTVWPALRTGGLLVVDDVDKSSGFFDFASGAGISSWTVVSHQVKGGAVAIAVKDGP